jgi:hypothetical protein
MLHMRVLTALLLLLIGAVCMAETKSQCNVLVKIDSIMYADTKDETVDSVTVCDDGKATAFHTFTEPALGGAPPQPTKWDYSGEINKDAVADLRKFAGRKEIADLPEHMNVVKTGSALYVVMRFEVVNEGKERNITVQAPLFSCTGEHPKMPKSALDLMCVFADLYDRVKTGASPKNGCGCKPLRRWRFLHNVRDDECNGDVSPIDRIELHDAVPHFESSIQRRPMFTM